MTTETLVEAILLHLCRGDGCFMLKGTARILRHNTPSRGGVFFWLVKNWDTREYEEFKTLQECLDKAEELGLL